MKKRKSTQRKETKEGKNQKPRESWEEMQERVKRSVHDLLGFWRICPEAQCRRAQACIGDREPCFARCWPLVPEEEKVGIRACMNARRNGLSAEESVRAWEDARRDFLSGEHLKLLNPRPADA